MINLVLLEIIEILKGLLKHVFHINHKHLTCTPSNTSIRRNNRGFCFINHHYINVTCVTKLSILAKRYFFWLPQTFQKPIDMYHNRWLWQKKT